MYHLVFGWSRLQVVCKACLHHFSHKKSKTWPACVCPILRRIYIYIYIIYMHNAKRRCTLELLIRKNKATTYITHFSAHKSNCRHCFSKIDIQKLNTCCMCPFQGLTWGVIYFYFRRTQLVYFEVRLRRSNFRKKNSNTKTRRVGWSGGGNKG